MLTDLRQVNDSMEPMGALQPGLPVLSWIPRGWTVWAVDLKDCFFTIKLQEQDCKRFAFSIPRLNLAGPMHRFEWVVLPQGMKNSPTMCQAYVDAAIQPIRNLWPDAYIIHYMDDILIAHPDVNELDKILQSLTKQLESHHLVIAPDKIQKEDRIKFLGGMIYPFSIQPQKIQIRRDNLQTLNDFQKLLGDINWIRSSIPITTAQLRPLFKILEGNADLNSPRELTPLAYQTLHLVEEALSSATLARYDPSISLEVRIFKTKYSPTGAIVQKEKVIYWVHERISHSTSLPQYTTMMAKLAIKAIKITLQATGKYPDIIWFPVLKKQINDWVSTGTHQTLLEPPPQISLFYPVIY